MSKNDFYYEMHYKTPSVSWREDYRDLKELFKHLKRIEKQSPLSMSVATITITQGDSWKLVEKAEYERLKEKYGDE